MSTTEPDYDSLLRSNLERVFNERDATKRELAVRELFVEQPVMYEPTDSVLGRAAIARLWVLINPPAGSSSIAQTGT